MTEEKPDSKFKPMYVDVDNTTLMDVIEEALSEDITKIHSVRELILRPTLENGKRKWIVRLEYDFFKDHDERSKVQI